jgi:hypothetical protein
MFAFSQIIAAGDKVSDVTKVLEQADTVQDKSNEEDLDILAFSNTLPGNDGEPKRIEVDEATRIEEEKARNELEQLNNNDATSAFGVLAQAQEIQTRVEE